MSATPPISVRPTDCCQPSCTDVVNSQVPGPAGTNGTDGTNGTNGTNAFTTTTAGFTMPAVAATVNVAVVVSSWASVGQVVHISGAGYFTVTAKPDATHITVRNLGYSGNAAPLAVIAGSQTVSPGGLKGVDGTGSTSTLNDLSPTTTKGDLIVDNGANNPLASDVRLARGTDGQILCSVAAQPTGLMWESVVPNAATDNAVPRFDGASGTPVPLQTSKVIVTDNGAVQASGSGGNARGADAVDLQVNRILVTQVASGARSFVGNGNANLVSGTESAVVAGDTNSATGSDCFIGAGEGNAVAGTDSAIVAGNINAINGDNSFIGAGDNNAISNDNCFIGAGENNIASQASVTISGGSSNEATAMLSSIGGGQTNKTTGNFSTIPGGSNAEASRYGELAHGSGSFSVRGDAQAGELVWRINTTDATVGVEMFLDGAAAVASIPVNSTLVFEILLVGRSTAGVCAAWRTTGAIQNNAGTTSLVAAVATAVLADGTGATWGVAGSFVVSANNTNDSLKLAVTGAVATTILWVASARFVQVKG